MAPFGTIATTLAAFSHPNSFSPCSIPKTNLHTRLCPNPVTTFPSRHHYHLRTYSITRPKPKTALHSTIAATTAFHPEAIIYMILLALQFGTQPVLTKKFTPKTVNRSTVVMAQEVSKFLLSFGMLLLSGNFAAAISGWSVSTWLMIAGVPAALYCVQNVATLMAYQNLDPLTFNVLNQTKTMSAALCCYLIIGRKQSRVQAASLIILFGAALIIEKVVSIDKLFFWKKTESTKSNEKETPEEKTIESTKSSTHFTQGVVPVLLASFISGLAGALVQKNLQSASGCGKTGGRNSYLFTMELCVASMIFFLVSLLTNQDGKRIREKGFFDEWTPQTMIPVVTNAVGGIVVGLVTKYAGAVKKGFALIFGLLLSGILQAVLGREEGDDSPKITKEQIVGGVLAALSLWMHSAYPYSPKPALLAK